MADLYLWTAAVSAEALGPALAAVHGQDGQSPFEFALLEWWNAPALCARYASPDVAAALAGQAGDLLSGSVFGDTAEARWRRVDGQFWLVLTAAIDLPAAVTSGYWQAVDVHVALPAWDAAAPRKRTVLLWGSRWDAGMDRWVELRIPRPLAYPVTPVHGTVDAVLLDVQEYCGEDGAVVAARRSGLRASAQAAQEEAEQ